ncbi:MAG: hypothetical protein HXY34_02690 [Candidatus Thorarchaeota archaeon]|nr:hypothetical protein [Candidatus Thorarchaeota archaeon]
MGKAIALLGLILIILALLPIWSAYITAYVDLSSVVAYFDQNIYAVMLGNYRFTEVMLALTGLGIILLLVGIIK